MSKKIVIQEGGVGRQFTADKLKTALVGGGSCLWVPEDETTLGTKIITENGTFHRAARPRAMRCPAPSMLTAPSFCRAFIKNKGTATTTRPCFMSPRCLATHTGRG